ncbi:MAG: VanZ family protein [Oscillospiraceae bacterium]|nr:VanZ family protein [Oscillospiraceae bacterium]
MTTRRKARLRLLLRLVLIATLCFIWSNSMVGKEGSASLSRTVTAWLNSISIPVTEHFVCKSAHFCEFGLLGCELMLLFWLRSGVRFQNLCNAAFAALLAAVTDETIQIFSGRGSQVQDVVLDFSGALTGILLVSLIAQLIEKRKS